MSAGLRKIRKGIPRFLRSGKVSMSLPQMSSSVSDFFLHTAGKNHLSSGGDLLLTTGKQKKPVVLIRSIKSSDDLRGLPRYNVNQIFENRNLLKEPFILTWKHGLTIGHSTPCENETTSPVSPPTVALAGVALAPLAPVRSMGIQRDLPNTTNESPSSMVNFADPIDQLSSEIKELKRVLKQKIEERRTLALALEKELKKITSGGD